MAAATGAGSLPAGSPIQLRSAFSLTNFGIQAADCSFKTCSMSSGNAIAVLTTTPERSITIIDTAAGRVGNKLNVAADGATLSPDAKVLAVRIKNALQLQNLEMGSKIKGAKLTEEPQFIKFANEDTLAIVTGKSVFHWNRSDSSAPSKVCDRHASLEGATIMHYSASPNGKWLMTSGLKRTSAGAAGALQLFNVEKGKSQALEAPCGCFATITPEGRSDTANVFAFVELKAGSAPSLTMLEVDRAPGAAGEAFRKQGITLPAAEGTAGDFPTAMHASNSQGLLYIFTRMGYVFVVDMPSATVIFRAQAADAPIFAASAHEASGGVVALTAKTGTLLLTTLDKSNVVSYISSKLGNTALAMSLAGRLGLAGADDLYAADFNAKLSAGDIAGAAGVAAKSPGDVLRNAETIARLQAMPATPGSQAPLMQYFAALMRAGRMNKVESIELARTALGQGRAALLDKWLTEGKLTCSEELGDLAGQYDAALAQRIYVDSGGSHEKVIQSFAANGEADKILPYARRHGVSPNYESLVQSLAHRDPKKAQELASTLVKNPEGPLIAKDRVVEIFMQLSRLQECTSFLLDALEGDRPDEGYLQTKLLEMNLLGGAPQVAEAILVADTLHHFDHNAIARLCEQKGLVNRALQFYEDIEDIKRCLNRAQGVGEAFWLSWFGTLTPDMALECLGVLLANRANEAVVVKIATQYSEQLGPVALAKLFEDAKATNGLFYYLGGIVNTSEEPEVHLKYIQAATALQQWPEVERVCRDSTVYDPEAVKAFLIESELKDPRPLIHVCDRFGFVEELTEYLHKRHMHRFIEVYVSTVSAQNAPAVIGKLLDLDADEDFLKRILGAVRRQCSVEELVTVVEERNRLRLLQPFLEANISEGDQDPSTHNAIGKIYITLNKEPQQFLKNNQFYDSRVLGKYCERMDPYLAFLAYKRAGGECDEELLEVTNANGLFKDQARYLVEKMDPELWKVVLEDGNPHRGKVVDQVTSTALPETHDPDRVSVTVKAFMAAELPEELAGLLEKLVLHGGEFADNANLQNLLLITAIQCSVLPSAVEGRVMDYINRLDNFDGDEIAEIALRDEYQLTEEAFAIYKKFENHLPAIGVLLHQIQDTDRASEYAERVNVPEVWSTLAEALLSQAMVKEAVDAYIKANDSENFRSVIDVASAEGKHEDLVRYLQMARKEKKERVIDSELAYSLALCGGRLADLESFVTSPNVADIQTVGDRCFEEALFPAAKVLYTHCSNNAKLAMTLVRLGELKEAVEAAKKANSLRTWQYVCQECVKALEFRLAQTAGLKVIVSPDHLDELVHVYEVGGHFEELIELLELGQSGEETHKGIFTELGVQYSRHQPSKLMKHVRAFTPRMNVSRMLKAVEEARAWPEAAYMHVATEEFDSAVRVMMEHSPSAFNGEQFLDIIQKVRNTELHYVAIDFYLKEEPMSLEELLRVLTPTLDHSRVVHFMRKHEQYLPLVMPYLRSVQSQNLTAVNEAINDTYIECEDFAALRESINAHDAFDQLDLAKRLSKHDLLEFRRIAALLYKRNKRFESSIDLSKSDNMVQDAVEAAAESGSQDLVEDLMRHFIEKDDKESFAAIMFTCYHLVRPDVALELAWSHNILDQVMPYMVQFLKDSSELMQTLDDRTKPKKHAAETEASEAAAAAAFGLVAPGMGGPALLTNGAYNPQTGHHDPYAQPAYGAPQGMAPPPPAGYGAPGYGGQPGY